MKKFIPNPKPGTQTITLERLREVLTYDAETGLFCWRLAPRGHRIDARVGTWHRSGHTRIGIDGRYYYAQHLAWLYVTGKWPENEINERDGDQSNVRFDNLRIATRSQNNSNKGRRKDNKSGHIGVRFDTNRGKWIAFIKKDGRQMFLGRFAELAAAVTAYDVASKKHHGEFGRRA